MAHPGKLLAGEYYHIYNRGNNRTDLFIEERNYPYFLELYTKHVDPVADTYAYCLLRNHFHFLIRFNHSEELTTRRQTRDCQPLNPSQLLSNLFNAYAKAINRSYHRTGSLFQRPFGRARVESQQQLMWVVVYIHRNPEKHGFVDDFQTWTYSSYHALLSAQATRLRRDDVLGWFGGRRGLELAHHGDPPRDQLEQLTLENYV